MRRQKFQKFLISMEDIVSLFHSVRFLCFIISQMKIVMKIMLYKELKKC